MSREAHVRFCESLGLQRPGPLTKESKAGKSKAGKNKASKSTRERGGK
jgi:hypothetical protein